MLLCPSYSSVLNMTYTDRFRLHTRGKKIPPTYVINQQLWQNFKQILQTLCCIQTACPDWVKAALVRQIKQIMNFGFRKSWCDLITISLTFDQPIKKKRYWKYLPYFMSEAMAEHFIVLQNRKAQDSCALKTNKFFHHATGAGQYPVLKSW